MKHFLHIFENHITCFCIFLTYIFLSISFYIHMDFQAYSADEIFLFLSMPVGDLPLKILFKAAFFAFFLPVLLCFITLLFLKYLSEKFQIKKGFTHILCIFSLVLTTFVYGAFALYLHKIRSSNPPQDTDIGIHSQNEILIPTKENIHFPIKKHNLIIILLESFEQTFKNKSFYKYPLLQPLEEYEKKGISFQNYQDGFGMTPSTPSLIALFTGLPTVSTYPFQKNKQFYDVYSLSKILNDAGYFNVALIACQGSYTNVRFFFKQNNMHQVIDMEAIQKMYPQILNKTAWGYADSDLFEIARQKIVETENRQPFFLLIQTMDTHANYHPPIKAQNLFNNYAYNTIYNTAQETAKFLSWLQKRKIYHNTTIVIVGDHLRRGFDIPYPQNRSIYNLFLNTAISTHKTNRTFNQIDLFATVLEALGAKLKQHKLGFGTSLFSNIPTLAEQHSPQELRFFFKNNPQLSALNQNRKTIND